MNERKLCWGIECHKFFDGIWAFGAGLSHQYGETYIYISFFKWSIYFGRIYKVIQRGEE